MTLRERLEARARDAGIPRPETLTAIQLLDAIHAASGEDTPPYPPLSETLHP